MTRPLGYVFSFGIGLLAMALAAAAQPTTNDPDFAIQGEYTGEINAAAGKAKVGVQVIALGDHKFRAVFFPGGLPGDGWDKKDKPEQTEAQTADGATAFKSASWQAKIKDGSMSLSDAAGKELGTLARVIRKSPTLGAKVPEGGIALFDGKNGAEEWTKQGGKGEVVQDGLLVQGVFSKRKLQSCTLHLEFTLPFEPKGRGQGRGNSGCYMQSRYEVQILDSFGLPAKDNECGGIYSVGAPPMEMCYPPLSWQTYDIDFTAAQYDGTRKVKHARMTVKHNGVLIHDNVEIDHATTAAPAKEGPEANSIYLQDHGHPVRFQNIWIVERK